MPIIQDMTTREYSPEQQLAMERMILVLHAVADTPGQKLNMLSENFAFIFLKVAGNPKRENIDPEAVERVSQTAARNIKKCIIDPIIYEEKNNVH